jgi:hypothetical protein
MSFELGTIANRQAVVRFQIGVTYASMDTAGLMVAGVLLVTASPT